MSFGDDLIEPETTGNRLVRFAPDATRKDMLQALAAAGGGGAIVASADAAGPVTVGVDADVVLIDMFGLAVVRSNGEGPSAAALQAQPAVLSVRPEFYLYPIDWRARRRDWLREGFTLLADFEEGARPALGGAAIANVAQDAEATWGVRSVGALGTKFTGAGIRVAVLDTGIAQDHPDFKGRIASLQDFSGDNDPTDLHGHGTHVAGTICGPMKPVGGAPRYGVAPDAELHVYKVLDRTGRGQEARIIQAMERAILDGCVILNLSLGRPAAKGAAISEDYENIGLAALRRGALVIAAAGNESLRDQGYVAPVGYPANSKSIIAVGAIDEADRVAPFSCGGINLGGGEVDLAGPGVNVFSATIKAKGSYTILQGTSMAAPHVSGVAALLAQSDPSLRGEKLRKALLSLVRPLGGSKPRDVGAGAVHV